MGGVERTALAARHFAKVFQVQVDETEITHVPITMLLYECLRKRDRAGDCPVYLRGRVGLICVEDRAAIAVMRSPAAQAILTA